MGCQNLNNPLERYWLEIKYLIKSNDWIPVDWKKKVSKWNSQDMQKRPHTFYKWKNKCKKKLSGVDWDKDISNSPAKKEITKIGC